MGPVYTSTDRQYQRMGPVYVQSQSTHYQRMGPVYTSTDSQPTTTIWGQSIRPLTVNTSVWDRSTSSHSQLTTSVWDQFIRPRTVTRYQRIYTSTRVSLRAYVKNIFLGGGGSQQPRVHCRFNLSSNLHQQR